MRGSIENSHHGLISHVSLSFLSPLLPPVFIACHLSRSAHRGGLDLASILLTSRDDGLLMTKSDSLLVAFDCPHPLDANLLFQQEVPLDNQNLLDDWNDRCVAILPHLRHRIDPPAYRNRFDLDALAGQ